MNNVPQFRQKKDPDQMSTHSRVTNESSRSISRRTTGTHDRSQHSVYSRSSHRGAPRRPGGPPYGSPPNSVHSSTSMIPRSGHTAKAKSSISEKVQWDGQCLTFRPYKLAITGHLLQNGGDYLVDHKFHERYLKYAKLGKDYLESDDFRINVLNCPVQLDWQQLRWASLFGT